MTEPSVETAEGRAALRHLADREYSLEPDWYAQFQAALRALDARDAALAGALAAERRRCAKVASVIIESHIAEHGDVPEKLSSMLRSLASEIEEEIRALRDPGASCEPSKPSYTIAEATDASGMRVLDVTFASGKTVRFIPTDPRSAYSQTGRTSEGKRGGGWGSGDNGEAGTND